MPMKVSTLISAEFSAVWLKIAALTSIYPF